MKRCLILTVVVLMVLAVALPALGQRQGQEGQQPREGKKRFQDMPDEEKAKLRDRFQNMSEEEKEKFRAQMRDRFGDRGPMLGRQEQLKIIEDIEGQLAKLKKAVQEGPETQEFAKLKEASPEEQAKLKQSWMKLRLERQKMINAIQEQLAKLAGPTPPTPRPAVPIKELQEIRDLAVKENAKGTAERLEKLIASYQKAPKDRLKEAGQKPQMPEKQRERRAGKKANVEG